MTAEFIDDTLDGSGQYPTKIPGYEDAADIQEALRLYHYGTSIIPPTSSDINPKSIAGYFKQLQTTIDNSADAQTAWAGVGIDWNSVSEQFDIDSTVATKSYVGNSTETITKTAGFILDLQDASKTILLSTSSSMTLTVPSNSSVAIPIGYQFHFIEIGSGRTTFSPSSGVTIGSKNSQLFLDGIYSKGTLVKIATDSWILYGDVYEGVASTTAAPTTTTSAPVVTTTTLAPVVTTTTNAPVVTTTTNAPVVTTTTQAPIATTTTVAPVTTTTAAPATTAFTVLPYETNVTHNSFTINWAATGVGSWRVYSAGTGLVYGEGVGNPTSFTRSGLTPTTTYTQTVRLWAGTDFTGSNVTDAITVSTNLDPASTYWATGCCSTTNSQVIGDSSVNVSFATSDMNSRCSGGTVTGIQTGYATSVPSINCTPVATTTTVAPTTTTAAPLTTYYGCCSSGDGATGTYASAGAAAIGLQQFCALEAGSNLTGGVFTTPQSCNSPVTTTTTAAPVVTTTTAAPAAFAITGTSSTSTSVTAYWANPPAFTTWYEYSVGGTTTTTGSTSATVSGLSAATSYTFTVRAKNSSNTTLATDSITIITTTPSATTTTVAPTTTTAAPVVTTTTAAPVVTTTTAAPVVTTTTAAPVTTWYCSTTELSVGQYRGTATSDQSGQLCNDFKTVCSTSGYPAYPSVPSCSNTTSTAAPVVTTTTSAPVVTTTTAAPVVTTTTAAPVVTTTTAAPTTNGTQCTSFGVSIGCCASVGCDLGGCGSGTPCTGTVNRCYQGGINC